MQPIIYRSTDVDAPLLEYVAGSFNTVIKACLVTGYGDQTSTGWEIAYENMDIHTLAIRSSNPQSMSCVLLLDDAAGTEVAVTAYKDWDAQTNIGTDEFASGIINKDYKDVSDNPYWVLIATDTFFYFWVQTGKTSNSMGVISGFGDAKPLRPDVEVSVLMAQTTSGYSVTNTGYRTVATSMGAAEFPRTPAPNTFNEYFGDRTKDSQSKTTIFSRFAMYVAIDERNQPAFEMPGMLMPYSEIWGWYEDGHIKRLSNQLPYQNPLVGFYQPWHGRIWLQVDDWGL